MAGSKFRRSLSVGFVAVLSAVSAGPGFAECYEQAPLRPVHRTFQHRDVVEPGVYNVERAPALYGWHESRVVEPGEVIWHEEPPVYRTVNQTVRVSGGWAWQWREVRGRQQMCRVRLPDTYRTVEKQVLVHRGRRWAERTPAAVGYVHRRILLRPYKNYAYFDRPHLHYWREHVAVQPEGYRWRPAKPDC